MKIDPKPCVVLVNLGTPEQPEPPAVRRYLRQFLSDRRVVETHPALWRPILEGIILRVRPRASAAKYQQVWGEHGSPLMHFTVRQAEEVDRQLEGRVEVRHAMRYGQPSVGAVLQQLHDEGFRRLLLVPLYPQFSATTSATVTDEVARWSIRSRDQFELRQLRSFPTHDGYVSALVEAIKGHWEHRGRPDFAAGDRLVLSYHGIPVSMAEAGDPYPSECTATTEAVRARLGLGPDQVLHTYQSVFGPAEWLKPATIDTVAALGKRGTRRVDVICPGFVSDCLETLEEIDMENRTAFVEAGGDEFHYLPWGNDRQPWTRALSNLVQESLTGWL
ncbi:ferrochelatase [Scrofimicrobium sp. R131]|uniref:Coproporphyrin III ferrochelatase n=1 Tax=Scrofimicrobium appendicitidis TaxID=3079930 RepID=A0AAU7V880_9ACTO